MNENTMNPHQEKQYLRGILKKNSTNSGSSNGGHSERRIYDYGPPQQQQQQQSYPNDWGSEFSNPFPGGPPQQQQILPPPVQSDRRNSIFSKLDNLLTKKGNLIFSSLAEDEKPSDDMKKMTGKNEDHYAVVPAFDFFLRVHPMEKKREFFKEVQIGELVIAAVIGRSVSGLVLQILCMDGHKKSYVEDLDIRGLCPAEEMIPFDPDNLNKNYTEGDYVRCEILKVCRERDAEKLIIGMKGSTLTVELRLMYNLGAISSSDLPKEYMISKEELRRRDSRTFGEILEKSVGFNNQNNTAYLASSFGIFNQSCTLTTGLRAPFDSKDMATGLRRSQNAQWARGNVAAGIQYFKEGNKTEAFQSLNQALTIDPENVEGLVARGALYSHCSTFEKAVDDFESALKVNPNHNNARKYLVDTLIALGRRDQQCSKYEEAFNYFARSLAVWPEHKNAIESSVILLEFLEKMDKTHIPNAAVAKILEVKAKLKSLLLQNIGVSPQEKEKKPKTDKRSHRDSSSSSSESESDDDSSKGGRKRRSKKSKKKSKKSKRSNLVKDSTEPLSPFSRRIATTTSGGLPVGNMSSQWAVGSNVSYPTPAKADGDSDSGSRISSKKGKHKKKSKKSKKKRRSSSSEEEVSQNLRLNEHNEGKRSVDAVIPDLGDDLLQAKIAAHIAKFDKGLADARIVIVEPPIVKHVVQNQNSSDYYDRRSSRRRSSERIPPVEKSKTQEPSLAPTGTMTWSGDELKVNKASVDNSEKWENRNMNLIRTVQNDAVGLQPGVRVIQNDAAVPPPSSGPRFVANEALNQPGLKFAMKFNTKVPPPPVLKNSTEPSSIDQNSQSQSKWRVVGSQVNEPLTTPAFTVTNLQIDTTVPPPTGAPRMPVVSPAVINTGVNSKDNIRKPSQRSTSTNRPTYRERSRSRSRSRSESPINNRRRHLRTKERRSRSRSRSPQRRRRISRSRSRSRSRSMSPHMRLSRFRRGRGGGPPPFLGRRRSRSRSRSPEIRRIRRTTMNAPVPPRHHMGGRGRFSKSRSRSHSGSRSPRSKQFVSRNYRGRHPVARFRGQSTRGGYQQFRRSRSTSLERGNNRNCFPRRESRSRSKSCDKKTSKSPNRKNAKPNTTDASKSKVDGTPAEATKSSSSNSTKEKSTDVAPSPSPTKISNKRTDAANKLLEDAEIRVGGVTTKNAADVEELLDKHKAQKKEELKKKYGIV